jgi:hypothetical protein
MKKKEEEEEEKREGKEKKKNREGYPGNKLEHLVQTNKWGIMKNLLRPHGMLKVGI